MQPRYTEAVGWRSGARWPDSSRHAGAIVVNGSLSTTSEFQVPTARSVLALMRSSLRVWPWLRGSSPLIRASSASTANTACSSGKKSTAVIGGSEISRAGSSLFWAIKMLPGIDRPRSSAARAAAGAAEDERKDRVRRILGCRCFVSRRIRSADKCSTVPSGRALRRLLTRARMPRTQLPAESPRSLRVSPVLPDLQRFSALEEDHRSANSHHGRSDGSILTIRSARTRTASTATAFG